MFTLSKIDDKKQKNDEKMKSKNNHENGKDHDESDNDGGNVKTTKNNRNSIGYIHRPYREWTYAASSDDDDLEGIPGAVHVAGLFGTENNADIEAEEHLQTAVPVNEDDGGDDDDDDVETSHHRQGKIDELEKKKIRAKAKKDVQDRIIADAEGVEVSYVDPSELAKKRKRRTLMIILLIMTVLGLTAGVIVVATKSSSAASKTSATTAAPSPEPVIIPTAQPEIFVPPSITQPTNGGVGLGDAFGPTPQVLDQTDCEGAFSIDSVIGGSIFGDITDTAVVSPVDTCEVIFRNGIGVWYKLVGQNNTRMVVSTCESNFDTQLSVFTGPSCGKLQCLAGSDQVENCGTGDQSKVAFPVTTGQSYYIYVQARRNTRQIFSLDVDFLDNNDNCDDATLLYSGPGSDIIFFQTDSGRNNLFGSTRGATYDDVTCNGVAPSGPGVWYIVEGINNFIHIDLFGSATGFDGDVFIFEGDGCGQLTTCFDSFSDSFLSVGGRNYYILVHGPEEGDFEIEGGPRAIDVVQPDDDFVYEFAEDCQTAVSMGYELPLGETRTATTESPPIDLFGSCGDLVFATSSQVWYQVIGTGGILTASTCTNITSDFDTQISVFRGTCDSLECIDGNDQACGGDQSSVSWFTQQDEVYLLVVHGYGNRNGLFTISLTEEEDEIQSGADQCTNAIDIVPDGSTILGTTEFVFGSIADSTNTGATISFENCNESSDFFNDDSNIFFVENRHHYIIYKVTGAGKRMTASTCDTDALYDSSIHVFRGDCQSLFCSPDMMITRTDCGPSSSSSSSHTSVTWFTEVGVTYYLYVRNEDDFGNGGNLRLTLEETVSNDKCDDAIGPLTLDGSLTFGSTRSATATATTTTPDDDDLAQISGRSVWYTVLGTAQDEELVVTTCSPYTSFASTIVVYEGSSCNDLVPVMSTTSNNDGMNGESCEVRWNSQQDVLYYIAVTGRPTTSEFGNFALSVFSNVNNIP